MLERKVTAEAVVQQLEQFMTRETFISITWVDIAKASAQDVIVALKNYLMPEMPFSFEYTETEIEKFIDKSKEVNWFSFASKMHIELRKNLSTLMDLDIFHKCCLR
jgi:seryl-tRNA synthetase